MGRIRVLYIFNLVFWDKSLDLKSLICAEYAWFAVINLEWISFQDVCLLTMLLASLGHVCCSWFANLSQLSSFAFLHVLVTNYRAFSWQWSSGLWCWQQPKLQSPVFLLIFWCVIWCKHSVLFCIIKSLNSFLHMPSCCLFVFLNSVRRFAAILFDNSLKPCHSLHY
jgi:hypothetical protein